MISNVKEVKARGAKVLLICREDAPEQKGYYFLSAENPSGR